MFFLAVHVLVSVSAAVRMSVCMLLTVAALFAAVAISQLITEGTSGAPLVLRYYNAEPTSEVGLHLLALLQEQAIARGWRPQLEEIMLVGGAAHFDEQTDADAVLFLQPLSNERSGDSWPKIRLQQLQSAAGQLQQILSGTLTPAEAERSAPHRITAPPSPGPSPLTLMPNACVCACAVCVSSL